MSERTNRLTGAGMMRAAVSGHSATDRTAGLHVADAADGLRPGVSVVVPVYRSVNTLEALCTRLADVLPRVTDSYELILVDDASPDGSWARISALSRENPWVRGIELTRNSGQHNALLCGIRDARFATVVTLDDDLQHPPEELPKLLAKLAEGHDVVYGTPERLHHGLLRDLASRLTKMALRSAMGIDIARGVSSFRAFRTMLRQASAGYSSTFVSIDVLLTWGTSRFAEVPVAHGPRERGESGYTWRRLATHALNMITGFSTLPLQFASVIGFAFTVFGLAILMYVLLRYVIGGSTVPGFTFLASLIAIFAGAQLFALGIVGEYLARMHLRMLDRPPYLVRERTDTR